MSAVNKGHHSPTQSLRKRAYSSQCLPWVAGHAGHGGGQGGSPHQACRQLLWSIHGIPFSHSPSPEDISVFLLPNLCCASKICSWAASRVEQAKPRSVQKEGGGKGQGSDHTKRQGKRVPGPSKQQLVCRGGQHWLLSPDCWLQCALGESSGKPQGWGPFSPAFQQEGTPPPSDPAPFKSSKQLGWGSGCGCNTCGVLTLCPNT